MTERDVKEEMMDCYQFGKVSVPSEAAMREALLDILHRYRRGEIKFAEDAATEIEALINSTLPPVLDRHAAAQRERDEKIADGLYQYQWRKDEYIYRENVGDAIRSAK